MYWTVPIRWKFGKNAEYLCDSVKMAISALRDLPFSQQNCMQFVLRVAQMANGLDVKMDLASRSRAYADQEKLEAFLAEHCPWLRPAETDVVMPGDILLVGEGQSTHALVCGWQPSTLWHTTEKGGVQSTGIRLPGMWSPLREIYRGEHVAS